MGAGSVYWSPDGSQLVFDARPEGNADINRHVAMGSDELTRCSA
jgi:Tol biopolymer transport system component